MFLPLVYRGESHYGHCPSSKGSKSWHWDHSPIYLHWYQQGKFSDWIVIHFCFSAFSIDVWLNHCFCSSPTPWLGQRRVVNCPEELRMTVKELWPSGISIQKMLAFTNASDLTTSTLTQTKELLLLVVGKLVILTGIDTSWLNFFLHTFRSSWGRGSGTIS